MAQLRLKNTKEFILKEYESLRSNIYENYTTRNNGYTLGFAFLSIIIGSCVQTLAQTVAEEHTTPSLQSLAHLQSVYLILAVLVPLVLQFMVVLGMSQEIAILDKAKYIKEEIENSILQYNYAIDDSVIKVISKHDGWETKQVTNRSTSARPPYEIFRDPWRGLAIQLPVVIFFIEIFLLFLVQQDMCSRKLNLQLPLCWGTITVFVCSVWKYLLVHKYLQKCKEG